MRPALHPPAVSAPAARPLRGARGDRAMRGRRRGGPGGGDAARRMGADVVIAVDISGGVSGSAPESTLDTIFQSINEMYSNIAAAQLSRADGVIPPPGGSIASGDFP